MGGKFSLCVIFYSIATDETQKDLSTHLIEFYSQIAFA